MGSSLSFPKVDLSGRNILVTGGNTGIGYETAKALAAMGGNVTVACRTEERGRAAMQRMRDELPDQTLHLEFAQLDLGTMASTRAFIDKFVAEHDSLHLLILNAGCAMRNDFATADGFEMQYEVNFLNHLMVTLLLTPLLRKALAQLKDSSEPASSAAAESQLVDDAEAKTAESPSTSATTAAETPAATTNETLAAATKEVRIIHVSSSGHSLAKCDLGYPPHTDVQSKKFNLYCRSKLFQVMIAQSLQRHFNEAGLAFHSVHPGTVKTEISRDFSGFWKHVTGAMNAMGQLITPEQGACTTLAAAISSAFDGQQSTYFEKCKPTTASSTARDQVKQQQLWNLALSQLKTHLADAAELGIDWDAVETARQELNIPASPPPAAAAGEPAATAAAAVETPAAVEETPAAAEETPAAAEETPAASEETPAASEETPAASEETPAAPADTVAEAKDNEGMQE